MTASFEPVVSFLGQHPPFDQLAPAEREALARQFDIEYVRRGAGVLAPGEPCARLLLIRSGGLQEHSASGALLAQHGEGASLGAELLLAGENSTNVVTALQDTLVYSLPARRFLQLCDDHPFVAQFFKGQAAGRLRRISVAPPRPAPGAASLARRVRSLLVRPLVSVPADTSIVYAAQLMSRERVSSVIVTGQPELGIVTDRDLRSRALAAELSPQTPVGQIMSVPLAGVDAQASLLEALMEMMARKVHHLAVFEGEVASGVITLTDLVQSQAANPVWVLDEVARQHDVEGLVATSRRRADVLLQLVAADVRAPDIHRILTQIGDAITRRLIELASAALAADGHQLDDTGYCWVAFGSQARQEHALGSDQDNGLIFDPAAGVAEPALRSLAERVCDGLDACGYPRCQGDIMAAVDRWRQPLPAWRQQFSKWIREPTKKAVMHGSIFFDMRAVVGNASFVERLESHVVQEIEKHPQFLAHLAREAMGRRPPLGFFGQLAVDQRGEHRSTLDLKHHGLIPVVDLARVYGLESKCQSANTGVRLQHARDQGALSSSGCEELLDAFEVIARVRLRYHARLLKRGESQSNHLDPKELSPSERGQLRDAFSVVNTMQRSMEMSRQLSWVSD